MNLKVFINHRRYQCHCPGMTLVELLLVLVLLVIVASLAIPILDSSFSSVRLNRACDQVMADFSRARAEAIESGQIYQFLFAPKESNYKLGPWNELEDEVDSQQTVATTEKLWSEEKTLPEQITFSDGQISIETQLGEEESGSLLTADSTEWSSPIFFFPDGSTSNASVLLENEQQLFQRITLRALTGVARASESLSQEEVQRLKNR